ncbi:MAG: hypothetical protein J7J86_09610 [Bacteroidales bacterium]|nr:hypothetical protein [Bacteroidales bacterium]
MDKLNKKKSAIGWIVFFMALFSVFAIKYIEVYNLFFLLLLTVNLIIALFLRKSFNKTIVNLSALLIGLLFIYSGFVKGVDPVGTKYQIIDYFIAYKTLWAKPFAMTMAVGLCAFEFILGVLMLFRIRIKEVSWLVLLMMIGFTFVTLGDALYNSVPDCGCFGKAIILSNWQTFYKNLIINVFVFIVFFSRKDVKRIFYPKAEFSIFLLFLAAFLSMEIYSIRHLPVIDFRTWKVGNRLIPENPKPVKYFLSYKNKETGEVKEYLSKDLPWQDSLWLSQWEFQSQRIDDPNTGRKNDVTIEDSLGNNMTANFIENPDFQFILIAYNLAETNIKAFKKINEFYKKCDDNGYSFIVLTSSTRKEISEFKKKLNIEMEFYNSDDTALEAVIRSNPGLVILKNAYVLGKWHFNDFPDYEYVEKEYLHKK